MKSMSSFFESINRQIDRSINRYFIDLQEKFTFAAASQEKIIVSYRGVQGAKLQNDER